MAGDFSAEGASLQLSSRETLHLHRVLRLNAGDACRIFNRKGQAAEAVIETISEIAGARLRIKKILSVRERTLFLKVAQALPQKRKMDELVEKAEELGVQELWVIESQRSIVKMSGDAKIRARERWERIVVEAAKQSGSPILTTIEGPLPFDKLVEEKLERSGRSFIFHPDPQGLSFSDLVTELKGREAEISAQPVFLFFGPEGGFTEEEVKLAESRGVRKVFLGDSTLRLETAFLGVISALRFLIV